ncbi:exo-alpha-sialidase [Haloechinothrix sp. LS1_15]|uniref:WD40/YVTN/BNR-like repeat-containing protein n=1 Tax=Haloechinothrix sp. LS1_15 TaxID=2652248 RepID=UPI0029482B1E|nr:exo-alpha-sialidase [Haloechinothrix sp. LS1_15]MDV6014695.1 exo-alpha-sialidase [Haloechinothrix sp. LS1_15]
MDVLLAVGTRKGLWLARSRDRRQWEVTGPMLPLADVKAVAIDTRSGGTRLLAAALDSHFGPSMVISDDFGATWSEPDDAPIAFPADTGAALEGVWQLAPGPENQPGVVYAGVEPSALFRSDDGGRSFELVRGLWEHPHREQWFPGGGGKALHTVIPHPVERDRVIVAMSTGGVYQTADAGTNWKPTNTGIRADFQPEEYPEFGQCVHKVAMDPTEPDRLFLQNHGELYRSGDGGAGWEPISDDLPGDFGFPVATHPRRPGVVYSFPISSGTRFPEDGRCRVYRSEDSGTTWQGLDNGLPEDGYWSAVLRDALCCDDAEPAGIYFGSRSGEVYASADEGDSWRLVARNLPDVLCVRAAVVG